MKINSIFFLILIFSFNSIVALSQNNTLIIGKVKNTNLVKDIELRVDELYINGKVDSYTTQIQEDNTFAFALEIKAPQMIKMVYSRNVLDFYIEPFDTLYMEIDANLFPYDVGFTGTGEYNNNLLVKYFKEFPKTTNQFEYLQYRSGIFWFHIPPKIDDMMQRMSKESYAESMKARQKNRMEYVQKYHKENPGGLTDMFIEYIEAEINYEYGYYMLCYGNVFKNKHSVTADFFDPLLDISLNSNQIGNFYFREYLKAYINYQYMDIFSNTDDSVYSGQYDLAEIRLEELSMAYFESEIITKALYKKKIDVILEKYYQFLDTNPYFEFNDKVINAYQKVMKYHTGSPAPSFELTNLKGETINLNTFAGQPVLLNFWASWCKPCMKKMERLRVYQKELEEKGIVFLNVSFDRKEEVWKSTIEKNNIGGVHVYLPEGTESEMAKKYNVRAIPQFYIIDKNGNFSEGPEKSSDILDLKQKLENLVQ